MWKDSLIITLRSEGPTLLLVGLGGAAAGALLQAPILGLLLSSWCYLFYQLWALVRLRLWQESPKKHELPTAGGLWADVYANVYSRYRQGRKRKKRLAEIVKQFRSSTNALPDAAVVVDEEGKVAWYNPAAGQMLNLRGSSEVGQSIALVINDSDFDRYLETNDDERVGVEISGKDGVGTTLWVRLVPYGQSQRLLIARDISERKRMEQTRRDFVSNASHELRTPLTVVSGYLEMMVAESANGDKGLQPWSEPLTQMHRQSLRMERIIVDMLRLANLEGATNKSDFEPLNIVRLLTDALNEAEVMSDGRHQIDCDIDDELRLSGHPNEIQSVVQNLLTNAVRYTPQGGHICLSWTRAESGERVLAVQDDGIGIDPDDIPRLTERFYRADVARSRETGGTGLGLAIVKHALERHGGYLEIHSEPGQGSRFCCVFPAQDTNDD